MVTWDSEQYLRFKRERTQPARDLAMQLPPDDGSVTRVLDIGCGPGNSTAVLRERYPHAKILGVDSSPDMIEAARKAYPDIDFQLCDVSTHTVKFVTFIDAMLSLVVTQDVLPEAEGAQHAAQSSGLFGIGLGALTMVIGLWMLLRRRWAAVDSVLDSEQ
mgnify:CR=1 FL=1